MAERKLPPQSVLLQILRYDPETGVLYWRERTRETHPNQNKLAAWNGKFAGKPAGAKLDKDGYILIRVCGALYRSHRVIWVMSGRQLNGHIDHINGNRADNRLTNLRCVDRFQNQKNMRRSKRNTSGYVGVHWAANIQRWVATIWANNEHHALGSYKEISDAVAARKAAERRFGFHKNHGN